MQGAQTSTGRQWRLLPTGRMLPGRRWAPPPQVVVVCILAIIWRTHTWAHYLVLGLALDNLGRLLFGAGPSPLAQAARCGAALLKPSFRPGVPKQFASACATIMSVVATVFMFLSGWASCACWARQRTCS